mmetsp:Transcript_2035/g.3137  ORF Transcript_2035/g.3137 Transcript_2035/m.3137 type:complete len:80 (+) Transcript_2035:181-420(+)
MLLAPMWVEQHGLFFFLLFLKQPDVQQEGPWELHISCHAAGFQIVPINTSLVSPSPMRSSREFSLCLTVRFQFSCCCCC